MDPKRDCAYCQCDCFTLDDDNAPDCTCGHKPDVHMSMIYAPGTGWIQLPSWKGE